MNRKCLSDKVLLFVVIGPALAGAMACPAEVISVDLPEPTLDRWFYPFNGSAGFRADAPIFGAVGDLDLGFDPAFDNRDGQMLIGFATSGVVPAGLGPESYTITQASVTVTIKNDLAFGYDPTADPYTSWLPSFHPDFAPDPDPGRPLELFGIGFRCDFTALTFPENGPFCDNCCCFPPCPCREVRCVYPVDFIGACEPRDISNNVDDAFDPTPFGVATTDTLLAGDPVPTGTVLTFEIDVDNACVQQYLGEALDEGMLDVLVASIFSAVKQQAGAFPTVCCKEAPRVGFTIADAAQLLVAVTTGGPAGDLDGDGLVGITDFLILLGAWGPCGAPCPPSCPADLDGDCVVGITDFLILLANWS